MYFSTNISIAVFLFFFKKTWAADWDYAHQESWSKSCFGNRQSPINIAITKLVFKDFEPIKLTNYSESNLANIINNGHSVEITLENAAAIPTISGGGLLDTYALDSIHLHWEAEHTVDEKRHPLEIHFVHHAQKYDNLSNALNYNDGVAVLGAFFETASHKVNKAIYAIASSVPKVRKELNTPVHVKSKLVIRDLLPNNVQDFFFYEGSLTTPNCNEVVSWTIFTNPATLTKTQLKKLTGINGEDNAPLIMNFRALNELNGRTVYTNNLVYKKKN